MKSFTKNYEIKASIEDVWECLTSDKLMKKWGAGPAKFDAKPDGEFNMWGDYLHGKVTNLEKPNLLEEDWVVDGMDEPSKVSFKLSESVGTTKVILEHSNIPDQLADELDEGWDDYYLGEIKNLLEGN